MADYNSKVHIAKFKKWIHGKGTSGDAQILKPADNNAFAAALHGMA
ncbi:hypothetical protein AFLA70_344g001240 [Aspergillus flavus AF70]|nr:hypothetical protein AFLA70_344g001240 [Aspergillus flavus AF70]